MVAQGWPIDTVSLNKLDLDIRNVRIPGGDVEESAIVNYLVESADLLGLMRDILRDGYLDNELPVVVKESGHQIVLEGNRRVAALKAIASPALLGDSAPRAERLKSRYPNAGTPTRIRVMIAPSRESAQPLLARLHTKNPKKGWIREQQAIFYHAQLSSTVTVDDLRMTYPGEAALIASYIRMGEMRDLIRGMEYDDPQLERFVNNNELKMSSFEYAYEKPKIQRSLRLEFSREGLLTSKKLTEGQRLGLTYLLRRFKDSSLNTRSPELRSQSDEHPPFVEYLASIVSDGDASAGTVRAAESAHETERGPAEAKSAITPRAEGDGATVAGVSVSTSNGAGVRPRDGSSSGQTDSGEPEIGSRRPNRGHTRSRLDMEGFEYAGASAGMRRRFEELGRIDVRDFPNAALDLLRTVLECSIKDYFRAQGTPLAPKKTIGTCVDELATAYANNAKMISLINVINRKGKMSAQQYAGTTDSLNSSNHEPDQFAQLSEVHEAWDRIKPILLEIVGKRPAASAPPPAP
jgi:hypothetical protein